MSLLRRLNAEQRRSVRHWVMELVVVVVGVLFALWLQELLQRRNEAAEMRAAEQSVREEVRSVLQLMVRRQALDKCLAERTQMLRARLLEGSGSWIPIEGSAISSTTGSRNAGTIRGVYQVPNDELSTAAWTTALTTGSLAPMDRERFAKLMNAFTFINMMREAGNRERDATHDLSALANPLQMTPEIRAEMLKALYQVDRSRFVFTRLGTPSEFASLMREIGWDDGVEMDRWIAAESEFWSGNGLTRRPCVQPYVNPFSGSRRIGQ